MPALDTLNANVAQLQTDVGVLIASQQPPTGGATEAQVQAVADQVAAIDAQVVAATPAAPAPTTVAAPQTHVE